MSTDFPTRAKVSVVTATYNALDGLRQTVESVAAQTMHDVEHVVVDGGSTDGTVEYLRSLGDAVRWVSEPDEGIADALNKGVAMARGEWILVLQAGDYFSDVSSLAKARPNIETAVDIVSNDVLLVGERRTKRLRSAGFNYRFQFFMSMPHQGAICRRSLIEHCGGFDRSFVVTMDYDFYFRARAAGAKVKVTGDLLAIMPEGGISTVTDWPSLSRRLREARRLHFYHSGSIWTRLKYTMFWTLYWPYKRFRTAMIK